MDINLLPLFLVNERINKPHDAQQRDTVLNLGRSSPKNQYILRLMQLESKFTEKGLVGTKLNTN